MIDSVNLAELTIQRDELQAQMKAVQDTVTAELKGTLNLQIYRQRLLALGLSARWDDLQAAIARMTPKTEPGRAPHWVPEDWKLR
jgi:hypothetical protein